MKKLMAGNKESEKTKYMASALGVTDEGAYGHYSLSSCTIHEASAVLTRRRKQI